MFGAFAFGQPDFGDVLVEITAPPPPVVAEVPAGGGYWKRQRRREEERRKKKRKAGLQVIIDPIGFYGSGRVSLKASLSSLQPIQFQGLGKVRCSADLVGVIPTVTLYARGRRHWEDEEEAVMLLALAACDC